MHEADLIIIGAGPAGMAAAHTAAGTGLSVLLLDEQQRAGGQIYRDIERSSKTRGELLGKDYIAGLDLANGLNHKLISHIRGATVWQIEDARLVTFTVNGKATQATGKRLLIATGALERPMPVPGWTLPGVMTAGAAQILLKQSGIVCQRAVLVGTGPLLYLIAAQMVRAGSPPLALVETQTYNNRAFAMRHVIGALRGLRYFVKGLGLLAEIRRAGIKRYTGAADICIEGHNRAETVHFTSRGREHRIEAANILLHHGVVPNTQVTHSIGVIHYWNEQQRCFIPRRDDWGRTNLHDVFVAGDGSGIGGAKSAELSGRLAALEIACDLDAIGNGDRDLQATPLRTALSGEMAVRPFIDRAYPPFEGSLLPADSTIICRCEEVTAGDIRRHAKLGCLGPNQTKAFSRSGMGPCQGRFCGLTVTELLAQANHSTQEETGYYRIRPPLKPVSLGELATLADTETKEAAK